VHHGDRAPDGEDRLPSRHPHDSKIRGDPTEASDETLLAAHIRRRGRHGDRVRFDPPQRRGRRPLAPSRSAPGRRLRSVVRRARTGGRGVSTFWPSLPRPTASATSRPPRPQPVRPRLRQPEDEARLAQRPTIRRRDRRRRSRSSDVPRPSREPARPVALLGWLWLRQAVRPVALVHDARITPLRPRLDLRLDTLEARRERLQDLRSRPSRTSISA